MKLYCDHGGRGAPWRAQPEDTFDYCPVCVERAQDASDFNPMIRVDNMSEIRAHDPDARVRGINLGLPPERVSLGKDSTGKERFELRPRYANEVGSNRRAREIAAQHGLRPVDGAYRVR